MENETGSDIILEGSIARWEINSYGPIRGTYIGTFKFRCFLTPVQTISANREMREMLGEQMSMAPEHESFMAYALTQLKYRVLEHPPFWNTEGILGNIPDEQIIGQVLDAAISAEVKYKEKLRKKTEESILKAKIVAEEIANKRSAEENEDEFGED